MNAISRLGAAGQIISLAFCVQFLVIPALAQEPLSTTGQRGDWDISVWVAGATGEENRNSFSESQILTAGIFVGKILTDETGGGWKGGRLEYGVAFVPLSLQLAPQRTYGGGIEPVVLRWNSSRRIGRAAPYIELAGGGVLSNTNLPSGNTSNFNFTTRGGGGVQIPIRRRQSIDIGCRWWHLSNANLGVRNPEFNGIQVSLGYHWLR